MTMADADVARRFAAAFTARSIDRVLECFTEDAVYADLFYGRFRGRAELSALFDRMYAEGDRHLWQVTRSVVEPACTMAEWRFTFTVSDRVASGHGRTLTFAGVSIFETRDGLCHTYREFFDRGAALMGLGLSAPVIERIVAARPSVEVIDPA